jgi:hypothetical protein
MKVDESLRLKCLDIASRFGANDTPGDTVARAHAFYCFLVGQVPGLKLTRVKRPRKTK